MRRDTLLEVVRATDIDLVRKLDAPDDIHVSHKGKYIVEGEGIPACQPKLAKASGGWWMQEDSNP